MTQAIDAGAPARLTRPELDAMIGLLAGLTAGTVMVGCSRDEPARQAARSVADAWEARRGLVLDVVDWPETAASWLRQARRFTAHGPDAWAVIGQVGGWVSMGRRLTASTTWAAERTVASASLADPALATAGCFLGLRGALRDGGTWRVSRRLLIHHPAGEAR